MSGLENDIMEYAQDRLSKRRFEHVARVVETLDSFAEAHRLDRQECRAIGWLHDAAKEEPGQDFLDLVHSGRIEIDRETLDQPNLWHGFHAAYLGREKFGIDKQALLDAVRYHPTGSVGLEPEGLALFVADYSEPGRPMEWTEEIRDQAKENLPRAAHRVVCEKIDFIRKKGRTPHSRSLAFQVWLEESAIPRSA
jgi:predicted HD superfamily hydrolase involved in NAD metabolism